MAQNLSEDIIRNLTARSNEPILFRQFIQNWSICKWDIEKWVSVFGTKEIPFRCLKKSFISDEPCWERRCNLETMTFRSFIDCLATSKKWMYFDYKYLHHWFSEDNELSQVRGKNKFLFLLFVLYRLVFILLYVCNLYFRSTLLFLHTALFYCMCFVF